MPSVVFSMKVHRNQTIGRNHPDENSEILHTEVFSHVEQHLQEAQSAISLRYGDIARYTACILIAHFSAQFICFFKARFV